MDHAIESVLLKSDKFGVLVEGESKFKKRMSGEHARDARLTLQGENKRAMFECSDIFHS